MPNDAGPHNQGNPKVPGLPVGLGTAGIIGYTPPDPPKKPLPTVYFTTGHLTLWHKAPWNIGWDSYVGWTPLFFGNVPEKADASSHDANRKLYSPNQYLANLKQLGRNRIKGAPHYRLSSWDLTSPDTKGRILREFWVRTAALGQRRPAPRRAPSGPTSSRGAGATIDPMDATDWVEKDWFAHPSRGPFIPVDVGAQACRDELWRLVEAYTKAQSSKSAAASSAANQLPNAYKLHSCP